ncbi:MAG: DUF1328 domain-containing protein [Chloroflexi bacterium]|nr:DUF1328 domain-containing protein [Chloroflexota bacterium]MCI0574839.1 DUF1328 domain-containing protein [Chloroflexota bacterium]MCI0645943.1 DUF1328 domain-containing protein [Chloroflexota bacterium]MCI0727614.1 DUF1328 domain-containing protein [Chloroflexota bacterium]
MLEWALVFLVIAIIAGALGVTGVARGAAAISKGLFGFSLVVALLMILMVLLGADPLAAIQPALLAV